MSKTNIGVKSHERKHTLSNFPSLCRVPGRPGGGPQGQGLQVCLPHRPRRRRQPRISPGEDKVKLGDSALSYFCLSLSFFRLQKFCDNEAFEEIKKRAIIVHVDMPGHEPGAEDLPDSFTFPCIQVRSHHNGFIFSP